MLEGSGGRGVYVIIAVTSVEVKTPFGVDPGSSSPGSSRYAPVVLLHRIWQLRQNLSAYDAAYVALAEELKAPLITRDQKVAAAPGHGATIEFFELNGRHSCHRRQSILAVKRYHVAAFHQVAAFRPQTLASQIV